MSISKFAAASMLHILLSNDNLVKYASRMKTSSIGGLGNIPPEARAGLESSINGLRRYFKELNAPSKPVPTPQARGGQLYRAPINLKSIPAAPAPKPPVRSALGITPRPQVRPQLPAARPTPQARGGQIYRAPINPKSIPTIPNTVKTTPPISRPAVKPPISTPPAKAVRPTRVSTPAVPKGHIRASVFNPSTNRFDRQVVPRPTTPLNPLARTPAATLPKRPAVTAPPVARPPRVTQPAPTPKVAPNPAGMIKARIISPTPGKSIDTFVPRPSKPSIPRIR